MMSSEIFVNDAYHAALVAGLTIGYARLTKMVLKQPTIQRARQGHARHELRDGDDHQRHFRETRNYTGKYFDVHTEGFRELHVQNVRPWE